MEQLQPMHVVQLPSRKVTALFKAVVVCVHKQEPLLLLMNAETLLPFPEL
jgi:hypothetical protein